MYEGEVHKSEGAKGTSEEWESGKGEGRGRETKRKQKFSISISGVSYSNSQCR